MQPEHIHIPLDRDAVYAAIWPALVDDIHLLAATDFMGGNDGIGDAECDAIGWLLDEITGNALTPAEAINMARELMTQQRYADYDFAREQDAAYQTVSAWPPAQQHALITALILDAADPLLMITELDDRIRQELDARRRDAAVYSNHGTYQMLEAITGRSASGLPLSEFEQDSLREQ
jgi:hypothetical protein